MDQTTTAIDWTEVLCQWGPSVGGVILALALVLCPLLIYSARVLRSGLIESARLHGRAQTTTAREVGRLAQSQHALARQIGTLRMAVSSGPAEYALRKLQLLDGGIPPEEVAEMREQVRSARSEMADPAIWETRDSSDSGEQRQYQTRIDELEDRASYASDPAERARAAAELRELRAMVRD